MPDRVNTGVETNHLPALRERYTLTMPHLCLGDRPLAPRAPEDAHLTQVKRK